MTAPKHRKWKAWENRRRPNAPGPMLHVMGLVETDNDAVVSGLIPVVPQETAGPSLILDLTLVDTGISGISGTTDIHFRPADYVKDVREGQYTEVQINWEGEKIAILPVEVVQ